MAIAGPRASGPLLVVDAMGMPVVRVPSPRQLLTKRLLDLTLAMAGLVVLLPLLILVAVLVASTSPGPVIIRQWRVGLGGKPFRILKFRTMRGTDRGGGPAARDCSDAARITPLGRLLRRTSVDELPQLLNVIAGEMSLVGPRPHVAGMLAAGMPYAELVPFYDLRHVVRPGLSGWAQASGLRGPTDDPAAAVARIGHDIAYIQQFSIWFDLKIIWITVTREFLTGTGV